MNRRSAALLVLLTLCASSTRAQADDWLGRDKALHFGATAVLASGGYGLTAAFTDRRGVALGVGFAAAMGAGVAKETWDATGRGDPSWKDLAWDGVGTAAGLLLAFGFDRLFFSRGPRAPREQPSAAPGRATFDLRPSTFDRYGVGARATFLF